jgi:predicted O-linked N-acetylglucosamine transferase (SPINDLY family)
MTFASFHCLAKLSGEILDIWARLLARVPGSRLLLVSPGIEQVAEALQQHFAGKGIDSSRIECLGKQPFPDYLALHNQVDINLDVFPYTGGTTTCHSLWMGVPVITLTGATATSRGGATLLGVMGLEELIADTPEQYIDIATALADNRARLAALRSELRPRMRASRLTDAAAFTRALEKEYRHAWRVLCHATGT